MVIHRSGLIILFYLQLLFSIGFSSIIFQEDSPTIVFSSDSNASITCMVINTGTFEWEWRDNNGVTIQSNDSRYAIQTSNDTDTSTLTVFNVITNDTGDYTCIVTDQNNNAMTNERIIQLRGKTNCNTSDNFTINFCFFSYNKLIINISMLLCQ